MNDVSFINKSDDNIDVNNLKELIEYAINHQKLENVIFSVVFINDEEMKELNNKYRNIDKTTDVLSFAFEDNNDIINKEIRMLGDIYISIDKVRVQALEYGHSFLREISFLMIHGFLHLLGYDHMNEEDEKEMKEVTEDILNGYGITR